MAEAALGIGAGGRSRPRGSSDGLGDHLRYFFSMPTPRIMGSLLALTVMARLAIGGWSWRDLVPPIVVAVLEPFVEWQIHVRILHFRPRTWRGRRIDLHAARCHRAHHVDPADAQKVFVPMLDLCSLLVVLTVVPLLLAPTWGVRLTAIATSLTMLGTYEWIHYLVHSAYKPKTRAYRALWRAHRWHHYRNERYWFGVTVHLADHLLGTYPDRAAVPLSATAGALVAASVPLVQPSPVAPAR